MACVRVNGLAFFKGDSVDQQERSSKLSNVWLDQSIC
jgi:hypothetical protein